MAEDHTENDGNEMHDVERSGKLATVFMPFVAMDNLLDKLKLLDYDRDFVKHLRMKPISRHYFAVQTNPGEQFYIFSSMAAWLIRKCAKTFDQPQEFDDPNSTVSNILDCARQLGISVNFPPSKLKQGCGDQVILILDLLADEALKLVKFNWKSPHFLQEDSDDFIDLKDESDQTYPKIEEDFENIALNDSDEDGDLLLAVDELQNFSNKSKVGTPYLAEILQTNIDTLEWKMELERVIPQLKAPVNNNSKDWRNHLDNIHGLHAELVKCLVATDSRIDKIHLDIGRSIEKIYSREKYLNTQLQMPLMNYNKTGQQYSAIREQYRDVSSGVIHRSHQLAAIMEELQLSKQEIEERSLAMTDGSPLISVKKALSCIKSDIIAMDVQTAVIEHSLLHAKLKDRIRLQREMSASTASKSVFANASISVF